MLRLTLSLACLLVSISASTAAAQEYYSVQRDGGSFVCVRSTSEVCTTPGDCAPDDCVAFGGSYRVCAPGDSLFCTPSMFGGCPTGRELRPLPDRFGFAVCMPPGREWCEGASDAELLACFQRMGDATRIVDFELGDCDRDGIPNEAETPDGLCEPVQRHAAISRGGACTPLANCRSDADCGPGAPVCARIDAHGYCIPSDGVDTTHFCCGGFLGIECPHGGTCAPSGGTADGQAFCDDPRYCASWDFEDRIGCLFFAGALVSDPADGDCDGDGQKNTLDEDPCTAAPLPEDAGVAPTEDAGTVTREDAGAEDASAPPAMDSGVTAEPRSLEPSFNGGGGCACRATPSGPSPGPWGWLGLASLGFLVTRRRQ